MKKLILSAVYLLSLFCFDAQAQQIIYVDAAATGANNGSSWINAYSFLNEALAMAAVNPVVNEIHVAEGTYFPTGNQSDTTRSKAFTISRGGVRLLGGYPTGGGSRNWLLHPTILSGDIGVAGNEHDNSVHVVLIVDTLSGADSIVVDGFGIMEGFANRQGTVVVNGISVIGTEGAGIYIQSSKLGLRHLRVYHNHASFAGGGIAARRSHIHMQQLRVETNRSDSIAGGLYLADGQSECFSLHFLENQAILGGGVFADSGSRLLIINTQIKGNTATSKGGGWYNASGATPGLYNILLSGNHATYLGSAWYSEDNDSVWIVQACITGNKADFNGGGALHMQQNDTFDNVHLINSIVWGNSAQIVGGLSLSHTAVEGGGAAGWNLPPHFVAPVSYTAAPDTTGDYHPTPCSATFNIGQASILPAFLTTDLDDQPRIYGAAPDLGCYELQEPPYAEHILYVDSSVAISGDGQSWSGAFQTLSEALQMASKCNSVDSILVAKGTYYPTGLASGSDRDSAFIIPTRGLRLIGGYANGGGSRAIYSNLTILSGDIGIQGDLADNSYHVLVVAGLEETADSCVIDGFYIESGNARGIGSQSYHTISVSRDKGGGLYVSSADDTLTTIRNCHILENTAVSGGGIYLSGAAASLCNVVVSGNDATNRGGGLYAYNASIITVNCLVTGNKAENEAGAIYNNNNSKLWLINGTISGNNTLSGNTGGVYNTASSETIVQNTTIFGNSDAGLSGGTVSRDHSLVQGWVGGTNNNFDGTTDPLFATPVSPVAAPTTSGNYTLLPCSPLINEGSNQLLPPGIPTDLNNYPRIFDTDVDIGAYELQEENELPTDTLQQTICNGDSVLFHGQYYHNSGFYADTIAASGCDSISVLQLTSLPLPIQLPVQSIDSCLSVTYDGYVYTSDTTLTDTIHYTGLGCDSAYRQILIQISHVDSSYLDSIICPGTVVQMGGQVFDSSGIYPVSFTAASSCDSIVILSLTVLPEEDSVVNATICPGTTYFFNNQNLTTAGVYYDTLQTSAGCDAIVTLHLNISAYATGSINTSICTGDSFFFNGQNLSTTGIYSDTLTTNAGCDSIVTLKLTVTPQIYDTITAGICAGNSYFFNGQNISTSGTYYDTLQTSAGCDSLVVLQLAVAAPAQVVTIDTAGCGAVTFEGISYFQSTQLLDTIVSNEGCDSLYKTVNITVWNNIPAESTIDTGSCNVVFYKGTSYFDDTTLTEMFSDIHGCDSLRQTVHIHIYTSIQDTITASICEGSYFLFAKEQYREAGTYTAAYTSENGCDSTITLILAVHEPPLVAINIDHPKNNYCRGEELSLTASGASRYHWWDENGKDYGYGQYTLIRLTKDRNVIWLRGYDEQNCSATTQMVLEAGACCQVFLPSAFSPNNDGLNDYFSAETNGYPQNFKMRIFNRYGKLIFISDKLSDPWDGTVEGEPADVGTYYYLITGNCTDGTSIHKKGTVTLLR